MPNEQEAVEKAYLRSRRAEFVDYEHLLMGLIALKRWAEESDGNFYFGGNLRTADDEPRTPDIVLKFDGEFIIGEAKRSLPNPERMKKEDYIKKVIEDDLMEQMKRYDTELEGVDPTNHDLFLFTNSVNNNALGILEFDYLNENDPTNRNLSVLAYTIHTMANTQKVEVRYRCGAISDPAKYDQLRRGISYHKGALAADLGKYKVFEENCDATPTEYVMVLLWASVIPELIQAADKENISDRDRQRDQRVDLSLDEITECTQKLFTLPTYSSREGDGERLQMRKDIIRKAMEAFCEIGDVTKKSDGDNPEYSISFVPLHEKDVLERILRKQAKAHAEEHQVKQRDSGSNQSLQEYLNE